MNLTFDLSADLSAIDCTPKIETLLVTARRLLEDKKPAEAGIFFDRAFVYLGGEIIFNMSDGAFSLLIDLIYQLDEVANDWSEAMAKYQMLEFRVEETTHSPVLALRMYLHMANAEHNLGNSTDKEAYLEYAEKFVAEHKDLLKVSQGAFHYILCLAKASLPDYPLLASKFVNHAIGMPAASQEREKLTQVMNDLTLRVSQLYQEHMQHCIAVITTPDQHSNVKINEESDYLFRMGNFSLAQQGYKIIYQRLGEHSGSNFLKIKFNLCDLQLNQATSFSIAQQDPLTPNFLLLKNFEIIYQTLTQKYKPFPRALIKTADAQMLQRICYEPLNIFPCFCSVSNKAELDFGRGNGGFDVYPGLLNIQGEQLSRYRYSQPSHALLDIMRSYLGAKKIINTPINIDNIIAGNGTTQLYGCVLQKIFHDHVPAGKNVILIPAPSYGLFVPQVYAAGGQIVTIPLLKSNNYKLTATQLREAIIATNAELFKNSHPSIKRSYSEFLEQAYLLGVDINKLRPLLLESFSSREALENNLLQIKEDFKNELEKDIRYAEQIACFGFSKLPLPPEVPKVIAFYFCNIHVPTGLFYNQDEVNELDLVRRAFELNVIEDLTHQDILFTNGELGYFGNSLDTEPYKHVTLLGLSKNLCAAALRLGIAYVSNEFKQSARSQYGRTSPLSCAPDGIQGLMFDAQVCISVLQEKALCNGFNIEDNNLKQYLRYNNQAYSQRMDLFCAFIEGLACLPLATSLDLLEIVNQHANHLMTYLYHGIPRLKLFTKPQGSFFVLVDFSNYLHHYVGHLKLETALDFYEALYATQSLGTIPAESMLCKEAPILRFTIAMSIERILEAVQRLIEFVSLITEQQLSEVKEAANDKLLTTPTVMNSSRTTKRRSSLGDYTFLNQLSAARREEKYSENGAKPSSPVMRRSASG